MIADAFNGSAIHLANHDVMLWAVSRAPLGEITGIQTADGLDVPLGLVFRQRLQLRFQRLDHRRTRARRVSEYNYRIEPIASDAFRWRDGQQGGGDSAEGKLATSCGTDVPSYRRDRPGMSAFAIEDGVVYHTYSTYARGVDPFFGVYHWLDRAPKGRNETGVWWHRHDEYDKR